MIKRVIAVIVALSLALPYFCLSGYAIDYVSGNVATADMQVQYRYRGVKPETTGNTWSGYVQVPIDDAGVRFISNNSATVMGCLSCDVIWFFFTPSQSIFEGGKTYRFYFDTTLRMCRYNQGNMQNIPVGSYADFGMSSSGLDGEFTNAYFEGNFYRRETGFIVNGTFTPQYDTSGPIRLQVSLSPAWTRPDSDYQYQPYVAFDLSDIILGTSGTSSVDAVNGYIEDAANQISSQIGVAASEISSVLMQIYRYMTGDQDAILDAILDNALLVYQLLNDNMLPAIINGFASLEGVVEDGFASTALEIQTQTAQLILTLTNAFNHLEGVIGAESDDIQAAIAAQTDAILAYLEDSFAEANDPALSEKAQEGSSALEGNEAIEGELQESLDNNVGNIDFTSYALPAGILNAVLWITNTFTGFYNELGDMQIVLTLPLVVGLILLMIGRGSRAIISASMRSGRRDSDA